MDHEKRLEQEEELRKQEEELRKQKEEITLQIPASDIGAVVEMHGHRAYIHRRLAAIREEE
jgi:predicted DNA binding CopG/RHH family protein